MTTSNKNEVFTPTIELVSADERGEIYAINLPGDRELMLLHSKAGSLRGGHSHDVPESVMVLTGKMRYRKMRWAIDRWPPEDLRLVPPPESQPQILREGKASFNEKGQIHMGQFLEDSWIIEFKIGTTKTAWHNTNYEPWRKQVEKNAQEASIAGESESQCSLT